ncbi:MAG: DUF1501 domain-containing protein [Akkermansiaceae bacterium]
MSAQNCLLARRLIERDSPFGAYHTNWDNHGDTSSISSDPTTNNSPIAFKEEASASLTPRKNREGKFWGEDSSCRSIQRSRFQPPAPSATAPALDKKRSQKLPFLISLNQAIQNWTFRVEPSTSPSPRRGRQ